MRGYRAGALWLLMAGASLCWAELPRLTLRLNAQPLHVEVVDTPEARQRGLMDRTALPASQGMLFVFSDLAQRCLWMKNTSVPLSAAFLDAQGRILNLVDLQPNDLQTHCSSAPARFALEVNQGWFARHGIQPGLKLEGLPEAKN